MTHEAKPDADSVINVVQRLSAANVSHWLVSPLRNPRVNHRTRWAELPWVKESGTT